MKDLRLYGNSKIDILEMQKYLNLTDYKDLVTIVQEFESRGILKPIIKSKLNGKKPALYNRYFILQEKKDYSQFMEELKYNINYELNIDYYLKHLDNYVEDRQYILKLSDFLNNKRELLKIEASINERSFQIWGREKYLNKEGGKALLGRLNLSIDTLNIYLTSEPLAYYSRCKDIPQKLLIIENKDAFYTFRRYLIGFNNRIFGENIDTVIYGSGKTIWNTFKDFELCSEPYLLHEKNELLYLGDIDYEGLFIYEKLYDIFKEKFQIKPFIKAYEYMIDKATKDIDRLPETKEGQNKNYITIFLSYFSEEYKGKIQAILETGKYIPQEIINFSDLL